MIRFRKYHKDIDPSNYYRAKLMLYFPWYDEEHDLLCGYSSYAEHYQNVLSIVLENEKKYTVEEIDSINVDEDSRPEHAWCQIAPSTEDSNACAVNQSAEILTELSGEDVNDNSNLIQSSSGSTYGLSVRFESAANPQIIPPDEYRKLMRGLNSKQRAMVMF